MKPVDFSLSVALAVTGFALPGLPALAQTDHSAHGTAKAPTIAAAATPLTDGTVKKIDKANKKVTLSHGPLSNGMPAMTMAFGVKDAAWLDQLKPGQKIRFAIPADGALTIVRFEPVR